jgi:hypothetical protein
MMEATTMTTKHKKITINYYLLVLTTAVIASCRRLCLFKHSWSHRSWLATYTRSSSAIAFLMQKKRANCLSSKTGLGLKKLLSIVMQACSQQKQLERRFLRGTGSPIK